MAFDVHPSSSEMPSKDIIDLSTPGENSEIIELTLQDDVQIVTPYRTCPYNVVKDIPIAIGKSSFSAMYPEDVEHIKNIK